MSRIWLGLVARLGFTLRRSHEVFASFDGSGTLTIAVDEAFDPDDCLAQMIFHELCHALVAGPAAGAAVDWGLANTDARDLSSEYATHRVQAALADRHGLREFMAVTTDWRPHWDALGPDPLGGDDAVAELARQGYRRARHGPWASDLDAALSATARVADAARVWDPVTDDSTATSLWSLTEPLHPLGGPVSEGSCGACAWAQAAGPGTPVLRCLSRAHGPAPRVAPRVEAEWPGCRGFEPELTDADCEACGACCREAFHVVPVGKLSLMARRHPELLAADPDLGLVLPRPDGLCVALDKRAGTDTAPASYRCRHYADRPTSCRDFAMGSANCLEARRRVKLSRPLDALGGPHP